MDDWTCITPLTDGAQESTPVFQGLYIKAGPNTRNANVSERPATGVLELLLPLSGELLNRSNRVGGRLRPPSLLLLPLGGYGLHSRFYLLGISEVVAIERLQIAVQFVHQRHSSGNVQFHDLALRNVVQVLHQRAQAVAVRRDQHLLPAADGRRNGVVPQRQKTGYRVFEALGQREF